MPRCICSTLVSIRSRLLGREILSNAVTVGNRHACFNPLPAVGPGDTYAIVIANVIMMMFQSAPGCWAGRYLMITGIDQADIIVSIRSRLLGREIPRFNALISYHACFNPLPAVGPGDTNDL